MLKYCENLLLTSLLEQLLLLLLRVAVLYAPSLVLWILWLALAKWRAAHQVQLGQRSCAWGALGARFDPSL